MTPRSFPLLALGAAALLTLAACSTEAAVPVTPPASGGSDGAPTSTPDDSAGSASGAGPVRADGMPDLPLEGCGELVEATTKESDFDWQWRFEFACDSPDAYYASVSALAADGTLAQSQNSQLGSDAYLSDINHFIGQPNGRTLDVDLKITGAPDDVEIVYLVTLRKND